MILAPDFDDADSLNKAFAGAHSAFCVTNFWEHFSAEKEKAQAKNLAEAARTAELEHVIWSTLEDTRKLMAPNDTRMPMLQEKYRVPHFDAKDEANAYFAELPVTYLVTCFYWDNLYAFGLAPKKGADGVYSWSFPMGDKRLAGLAVEDIGKVAYGIFAAGPRYIGQTVGITGENLTLDEMSEKLSEDTRHRRKVPRCRAGRISWLRLPWRRRDGEHVPDLSGLREGGPRCAKRRYRTIAQSVDAGLRSVARQEQRQDSPVVGEHDIPCVSRTTTTRREINMSLTLTRVFVAISVTSASLAVFASSAAAQLPDPGMVVDDRTALVLTDPQNDFLSPDGVTWGVVGESVAANNTVANIETLLQTARHQL